MKTRFMILSPIVRHKKGEHKETLKMTKRSGFVRARIDNEIKELNKKTKIFNLSSYYSEKFFETKKIVLIQA